MAEEKSYHFNNDIWFISSNDVLMTLAIMEHLFANHKIKSTLCEYEARRKCASIPYVSGETKICAPCRYEARKICAIYMDLPKECVDEIDREYLCNRKVELNLKIYRETRTYKIIFKNELPYLTASIKQKEEENKPKYECFSEEDLQDKAKSLKYSHISNFFNKHAAYSLDIERVSFEEKQRNQCHPSVCMSNYIIKLWNYCALNGFDAAHSLKDIFFGKFPYEPYEILKNQLNEHGLFGEGWKRFERIAPTCRDVLVKLIMICGTNRTCLPFKSTHKSYELDQEAVPMFWDQVFTNIEKKDKRQVKIQQGNNLEGYSMALVQQPQIVEILAIIKYLQLIKSTWSDMDRIKTCAIYQQKSEAFVAQLHSEFLIKKKIDMSFKPRKGEAGKLLCMRDKEYETVDNCSHTPPQEVNSEEMINVAETLKWSSYANFLSYYTTVSKPDIEL